MKIAILGAGAMGSVIGSLLADAGNEITLIDVWAEAVAVINRDGLRIQDRTGESRVCRVRAVRSPAEVTGPVDLLLVFVKCYHTAEAVRSALPLLGTGSTVLSLQNGWGNGPRIAQIAGAERMVLGVCYHSATVLGPGLVLHAGRGRTVIGEMDGSMSPRVQQVADRFTAAGMETEGSAQILREIWSKLALNVATLPTQSAIRLTADRLLNTPEMRGLMKNLLREVVAVAGAQNIPLDFTERWAAITGLLSRLAPNTRGSMLQDVEKGRRTEIDVMCGAIIEAGARLSVPTPCNTTMFSLIKALEANYPVPA